MPQNNILSEMPIDLGDNLKLRFATVDDIDALTEFNVRLHEAADAGPNVRDLMSGNHPTCKASDFTVVEDITTGKIVSSMCLISQTWTYSGIPFPTWAARIRGDGTRIPQTRTRPKAV